MDAAAVPPASIAALEPSRVRWYKNALVAPLRRGAMVSGVIGATMLLLASTSMATGEVTLFTFVLIFLMFYFADNAMGRYIMSRRAPREVGLWDGGAIVRGARREDTFLWTDVTEVAATPLAGRFGVLTIRTLSGPARTYAAVPAALASEVKVSWLEAQARRPGVRTGPAAARPAASSAARPTTAPPNQLQPSFAPAFWNPQAETPPPVAQPVAPAPVFPVAREIAQPPPPPQPVAAAPPVEVPGAARPEWSFTRIGSGEPTPDPRYPVRQGNVESFRWHFIPTAGSQTGAWLLLAVVVLASIVISRITADLALSLLGFASDPWAATGLGLAVGMAMALVFYRLARGEISGEVAGSVIFLPIFDRTKSDIADSLREAGISLDAGDARVRESRGRLIITWTRARTRAVVVQASHESRAILLRTIGRGQFDLHQRFKGAILERLQAGRKGLEPQTRK